MKYISILSILFFSVVLHAQNLDTTRSLQFTFSGSNPALQAPNRFVKNSDNSFIVSTEGGDIRRLTVNGDTTSLNDTSFNQIRDLEKLNDGNFIAFGNSKGFPSDAKMVKFDSSGTVIWSKKYLYQSNFYTFGSAIEIDSGQIIAAATNDNNFALFKLDSLGDTIKVKEINRRNFFGRPAEIIKRKNGTFILAGADDDYPFAVGFNSNLDTLWSYYEQIFISHSLISVFEEDSNNIRLFAGKYNILLDSVGNKISDTSGNNWYHKVIRTDTAYLGVGYSNNPFFIAQATSLTLTGDSVSTFVYNDTSHFSSLYRDVISIDSGCYAALGSIRTNAGNTIGLLSYFGNCFPLTTSLAEAKKKDNPIQIYPNPNNGQFNINGNTDFNRFEIYSSNGKLVKSGALQNNFISGSLKKGIYFLRLFEEKQVTIKKVIVQ